MGDIAPWRIETADGVIEADFLDGQLFSRTPGAEIEPTFAFVAWGVDETPRDRHSQLQPFVDAAVDGTTIRTGRTQDAVPYYREALSAFDVQSLLVALVPDGSDRRGGVWAVLRSGVDETPAVEEDVFVWTLELTVLAQYESGDSRSTIESQYRDEVRA